MLDMTDSIAPKSDQMNADDLMSGPRTFTITEVKKVASPEQPIDVHLEEFPHARPFKPSKSMRRVMVAAWGKDGSMYVGHRMTLYRDPTVRFGADAVGGIRISHMSHIDKTMTLALTVTRGKRSPYIVKPLAATAPTEKPASAGTLAELVAMFDSRGIAEEARLPGVHRVTGGSASALEVLTEDEARKVIAAVAKRPEVERAPQPEPEPEPLATEPYDEAQEPEGWK